MNEEMMMRRRAVWRWKSFWLGVLVLCFLGWVWVRSMGWHSEVTWQRAHRGSGTAAVTADGLGISAWQDGGNVSITWDAYSPFVDDGLTYWSRSMEDMYGLEDSTLVMDSSAPEGEMEKDVPYGEWKWSMRRMFPDAVTMKIKDDRVHVAHWFLCVMFFLVWAGWMVWRWRRVLKTNAEHRTPNVE